MTGCYGACPSDDIQSPDSHTLPWGEGGKNADVIPTSKDLHIWLRSQNTIKKKLEIFKVRVWCVEQRDPWLNEQQPLCGKWWAVRLPRPQKRIWLKGRDQGLACEGTDDSTHGSDPRGPETGLAGATDEVMCSNFSWAPAPFISKLRAFTRHLHNFPYLHTICSIIKFFTSASSQIHCEWHFI